MQTCLIVKKHYKFENATELIPWGWGGCFQITILQYKKKKRKLD